jgi:hypothetical protein
MTVTGTYVECLQKSDFPLRKRSSALSPRHAVLRGTRSMEERVGCRAGIYFARLCISELSLIPTQRGAVCAMFFEEVRVFESKHR